jgi:hypothetical protein
MPRLTDQEVRDYIKRVEQDTSLPAGERLRLLTSQGLWSGRLWEETKVQSIRKIQSEMSKPSTMRTQEGQVPEEDLVRVKLNLMDDRTKTALETVNFLSARYPNTPTIKAMEYLKRDKNLLAELLDHLRRRGVIIF